MSKKVLVTGVAGFIGSFVAKALLDRGDEVIGIDNLNDYYDVSLKKERLTKLKSSKFKFVQGDITDLVYLHKLFQKNKFDVVCHLAAQAGVRYSLENPFAYEDANGKGMLTVLECCRKNSVSKLVYASSSSVYGGNTKVPFIETDLVENQVSLYAATKRYNEIQAKTYNNLYGIESYGLRFFTVYGPEGRPDMAPFKFLKKILNGDRIDVYNNGNMRRDFTFVDDIVSGVVLAIDKVSGCEIINLCRGEPVELMDFINILESSAGVKANIKFLPMQKGDVYVTYGDCTKAKKLLGYSPKISLGEGISKFVSWYRLRELSALHKRL